MTAISMIDRHMFVHFSVVLVARADEVKKLCSAGEEARFKDTLINTAFMSQHV